MKTNTIIISAIIVVVVGGLIGWWLVQDKAEPSTNTTTNGPATNNSATKQLGALVLEKETVYQTVDFRFNSASFEQAFSGQTAAEGKQFVIIYLAPFGGGRSSGSIAGLIEAGIRLVDGGGQVFTPKEVKVVSSAAGVTDQGHMVFEVEQTATDFNLRLGEGEEMQEIDLGI